MKRTTIRQDPEIMKEFGPCVPVKVTGDETTQETLAQISTGAAGSYIDLEEAARLRLRQTGEHLSRNYGRAWQFFPSFDAVMEVPRWESPSARPSWGLPLRESGSVWPAIIGRDALDGAGLEVNGPGSTVRISREG